MPQEESGGTHGLCLRRAVHKQVLMTIGSMEHLLRISVRPFSSCDMPGTVLGLGDNNEQDR